MYGFYLHRDMHGYFNVNQLIHQKIVEASRNETLKAAYANFAGRIRRVRYSANFARKRERWGEAMREHETILEALAPPRRQRTLGHPVQAPAQQAHRRGRAPQDRRRGRVRTGLIAFAAGLEKPNFAFKLESGV